MRLDQSKVNFKNNKALSITSVGILSTLFTGIAHADLESGKAWLSTQENMPTSSVANNLQTKQAVAQSLKLLQSQTSVSDLTTLLDKESSTEGLVRLSLLAHTQDEILHPAWQKLINNQNADGGFGHIEDWQSNSLDTAFVLIALSETSYLTNLDVNSRLEWQSRVDKALKYLATQQNPDGAYRVSHLDELYTSSYVLSALTPYLKNQGQYIPIAQKLVVYLNSKQSAPATWSGQANNKGLFLDALVAESLYPYQDSSNVDTFRTRFKNRVLTLQNSDGSWQGDAYVTALVLRSLDKLSQTVVNPITSAISLSVIDTETALPLSGVVLTAKNSSSPQPINISSDSSGNLIINDVEPGNYVFTLKKDGYASVQFNLRLRKGEQINLGQVKLSRAAAVSNGQIQGVVTSKVLGSPIAGATVAVVLVGADGKKLDGFAPIVTTTNNEGAYQIVLTKEQQQASQGRFGIDVRTSGYAPVQGSGTATAGGVTLFSPQLIDQSQSQAILRAKVVDATGQPLSSVLFNNRSSNKSVTSDASGSITVNGLDSGAQVWTLNKEGYQGISFSFVVEGANTYDVGVITLNTVQLTDPNDPNSEPVTASTGTFLIAPTDAVSKQKLQGFKVIAEKINENTGAVVQTQSFVPNQEQSAASELSVELQTGKWRITVSHPAYKSSVQTLNLSTDEQITVAPALALNPYALSGSIVDSQTNKPIANAPVAVFDNDTERNLYTGKSDGNGNFTIPSNLSASNVRIEIDPALYLPTTRYISRQAESETNVTLGEIRLRPKSAEVVLPDLTVASLDSSDLTTDQQRLTKTGTLKATIENRGNADLLSTEVGLTAFIDDNKNRKFDDDEQIVGRSIETLDLGQGANIQVNLTINGKVDFRDAPIAVMIDSESQIAERDEDNNVRLTSDGVEIKPPQGTMETEITWSGGYGNDSGAIAAPLEDTNGDGIIGQGDVSSILVYRSGKYNILDGKTGVFKFSVQGAGSQELAAIGDVDVDGLPDIVVTAGDGIRVYSNTGELKKTLPARLNPSGWSNAAYHPIIADLDQDGIPEIIQNNKIFTYADGLIKDSLPSGESQATADINGDGILDIIGLSGVSDSQGNELYKYKDINNRNITLKFVAIGDVLGSKTPQIVAIYSNYVMIIDAKTGKTIGQYTAPASDGGSPVIADFDGDGISDIGLARTYNYVAMRGDGSVIWNTAISDSSGGTGSTVFDFDNDGKTEAVHFDERYLRIYDAATGVERIKIPNNTATAHEYPIVGDFDADGHADILITSTGNGTRMISSKNKDWANTRNIWNQYSYHVTNINDDLSVPKNEPNSWEVHNTYRANLIPGVNVTAASDLTASYIQIDDRGTSAPSRFTARIGNAGGKSVAKGTPVSFYRLPKNADNTQAELIGKVTLTDTLAGGDYVDLSVNYTPANGSLADFDELIVVANDAGAGIDSATGIPNPTDPTNPVNNQGVVQEYTRSNNIARIAVTGSFAAFSLAGSVDKTSYTANDTVTITASPTNLGSFPTAPSVRVSIIDSAGNTIQQFVDSTVDLSVALTNIGNPPVNSANVLNTWQTGQTPTGQYTAHIELVYQDKVIAELDRAFAIIKDGELSAQTNSQLYVDKTQYLPTDLVQIHSRLINTASNAMAGQRNVSLVVADPSGKTIWTQSYSYDELAPNAIRDQYFNVPLSKAMIGNYSVTSTVMATDGSQAEQTLTQSFNVLSAAQSGFGVAGTLTGTSEVNVGDTVNWQWSVDNESREKLNNLPLSIALYRGDSSEPFKILTLPVASIDANGTLSGISPWVSSGVNGERITAVLLATFAQGQKGLAQSQVILSEPPISVTIDDEQQLDDTLLVYYSCAPGWHTAINNFSLGVFENECFDQRAAVLERYLDRINVPYKLVKRPEQFAHEMQSGIYAQYWLLGAIEQLRPHTRKELTELTYSGDNLLIDSGMNSWLNQNLYPLAGATHEGRLLLNNDMLALVDQFVIPSNDPQIANASLNITNRSRAGNPFVASWVQWLAPIDLNKTEIWATIKGQPKRVTEWAQRREHDKDYPAILSQRYGNGKPVATSFDVISSLDLATSANLLPYPDSTSNTNAQELHWDNILTQTLLSRRQNPKLDYVPSEVVRTPIKLANTGSKERKIFVKVDLPSGSQWLGYNGGTDNVTKNDDTINYQITVKAGQTINDVLTLRLPAASGTHPLRVTVSDVTSGAQNAPELEQIQVRYLVRDIDARINLINNTIQSWNVLETNGFHKLNAKTKMSLIYTHRKTGVRQLAVYEAANLATVISIMQEKDNSKELEQLRYEIDELLRALQIDWYMERDGYIPLL
ncbi:carboxypeptidase regulatory-like domain-containing protein [Psychrobacter celer]|uniref:carboxypeptidase regulatory-like domain-containing protein n=1 Tax=Psychrobacter celer TaxID=306572 RepID=UPI003FD58B53